MIDLYYWTTPNGHKITMFLEETGLKYKIFPINIGKGDQFKPEFLAIAPNNRIPAMVDHEPKGGRGQADLDLRIRRDAAVSRREDRTVPARRPLWPLRRRFNGRSGRWAASGRWPDRTITSAITPQEKIKYAIDRYVNETNRLYGVLNKRLADREFIGGEYSIADMACYPWVVPYKNQGQNIEQISRISSDGSRPSASGRQRCALTRWPRTSIRISASLQSAPRKSASFCSGRPQRW